MLAAAPAPEGPRGDARARSGRSDQDGPVRRRAGAVLGDRLPQRGNRGVPRRRGLRRVLLHRDEHAHPGRAPGDRGRDGRRPGRGAAPHRRGRAAAADPGRRGAARLRARAAHQRRGSRRRLHAQPGPARARRPARRPVGPDGHLDGDGRRGPAVLRLAAGQADRLGRRSCHGARARPPRARRARRDRRADHGAAARPAARRGVVPGGRLPHGHARDVARSRWEGSSGG